MGGTAELVLGATPQDSAIIWTDFALGLDQVGLQFLLGYKYSKAEREGYRDGAPGKVDRGWAEKVKGPPFCDGQLGKFGVGADEACFSMATQLRIVTALYEEAEKGTVRELVCSEVRARERRRAGSCCLRLVSRAPRARPHRRLRRQMSWLITTTGSSR